MFHSFHILYSRERISGEIWDQWFEEEQKVWSREGRLGGGSLDSMHSCFDGCCEEGGCGLAMGWGGNLSEVWFPRLGDVEISFGAWLPPFQDVYRGTRKERSRRGPVSTNPSTTTHKKHETWQDKTGQDKTRQDKT